VREWQFQHIVGTKFDSVIILLHLRSSETTQCTVIINNSEFLLLHCAGNTGNAIPVPDHISSQTSLLMQSLPLITIDTGTDRGWSPLFWQVQITTNMLLHPLQLHVFYRLDWIISKVQSAMLQGEAEFALIAFFG